MSDRQKNSRLDGEDYATPANAAQPNGFETGKRDGLAISHYHSHFIGLFPIVSIPYSVLFLWENYGSCGFF
jgi:hypothetical protein